MRPHTPTEITVMIFGSERLLRIPERDGVTGPQPAAVAGAQAPRMRVPPLVTNKHRLITDRIDVRTFDNL